MAPMQGGGTNNYGWAFFVMHQMITMYTKSLHMSSAVKHLYESSFFNLNLLLLKIAIKSTKNL